MLRIMLEHGQVITTCSDTTTEGSITAGKQSSISSFLPHSFRKRQEMPIIMGISASWFVGQLC